MLSKSQELLLHFEFMKLFPEMREQCMVFGYLLKNGFTPIGADHIGYGTKEYFLVLDAIKYQELING